MAAIKCELKISIQLPLVVGLYNYGLFWVLSAHIAVPKPFRIRGAFPGKFVTCLKTHYVQCSYGVKASCGESPPPSRLGGLRRRLGGLKRLGGPKQGSALSPRRRHKHNVNKLLRLWETIYLANIDINRNQSTCKFLVNCTKYKYWACFSRKNLILLAVEV